MPSATAPSIAGICYGLIEPAYEQARVVARVLCGEAASYPGSMPATNLKVSGVPVFSAGDFEGEGAEPIVVRDEVTPAYRKLVVRDGRLGGAVLVGDTHDALWYAELIRARRPIGPIRRRAGVRRGLRGGRVMGGQDFTDEQKRYLEGFVSGVQASRAAAGLKPLAGVGGAASPQGRTPRTSRPWPASRPKARSSPPRRRPSATSTPSTPTRGSRRKRLPGQFPKGVDNFRWRFHGLFYVAPTQNAYMCRLRIPNGILTHWQLAGIADVAERYGGGYAHVTTRANLQIREVAAGERPSPDRGAARARASTPAAPGADNIRNVTGSPTAGIDPQELLDTRPYARAWHHHILNSRTLYGLPRKFNVGFDGGGVIPVLEDTNDIAFTAVHGRRRRAGGEPGVWFRLGLGGITGHQDFARPTGVLVKPEDAVAVADADRARVHRRRRPHRPQEGPAQVRARRLGLREVPGRGGSEAGPAADARAAAITSRSRTASTGRRTSACIAQKQAGLRLGRRGAAGGAHDGGADARPCRHGAGPGRRRYPADRLAEPAALRASRRRTPSWSRRRLQEIGLTAKASSIRAGLVACTGNTGCKFALSNTKGTAMAIAEWVEPRVALDTPINIHLTGCPHSCAQHYIGDIGLLAARVPRRPTARTPSRAFTCSSAAASARTRRSPARSIATCRPSAARRWSRRCCGPISRIAPARRRPFRRSRAGTRSTRCGP